MTQETILGPPGTGKTQTNSNKIRNCLEKGISPDRIACVSFTRKAAQESRQRVCNDWGIEERDMPYFQTLHSMAFRAGGYSTDEVVGSRDMEEIGKALGMAFGKKGRSDMESDFDTLGIAEGDFYMSQYHLARSKSLPLEEMHRIIADYNVQWPQLKRLVAAYEDYKKARNKIDFTDMIENFIKGGNAPYIDALFVDEAQDLSTLQWAMVDVLRERPSIQVFTGDDDQAIMGFQGADVKAFLNATEKKTVLEQSYRLPRSVWREAQNIGSRRTRRALFGSTRTCWMSLLARASGVSWPGPTALRHSMPRPFGKKAGSTAATVTQVSQPRRMRLYRIGRAGPRESL